MAHSTVLRLERRIQAEHQEALAAIEQAYGQLAEALLIAARNNGYFGSEPLGALSHILRPRIEDHQLGSAVRELWSNFFNSFRQDEQAFEAKDFIDRAGRLQEAVQALGEEELSSDLAIQMLNTLSEFWPERQQALSERIDLLINNLKEEQQARGSSDLTQAHAEDEIRNTNTVLMATLAALGVQYDEEEPLHKKLEILLRYNRDLLAGLRDKHLAQKASYEAFQDSLKQAAAGAWDAKQQTSLVREEKRIVDAVAGLLKDVEDLENDHAQLREEMAQLQAEKVHLENGIKERDQRLAQYEFGANETDSEDERLGLYRQIMAAEDQGKDATDLIERVRSLERVLVLDNEQQQHLHKLLDRQLETIAKTLSDMRQLIGLIEDTKKYRPRLLGSSPYKLKTLSGVLQALRDAGRDVQVFVEKMRWAKGVQQLTREFRGWKKVFKEMVKLVKAIRDEEGAPSISSTISVDLSSGIAALPVLLSRDVDSIMRGRGASKYAQNLIEIFDEVVTAFHGGLEKSSGESIERPDVPKRESAANGVRRLNDELLRLASFMEEHFSDAAENGYELSTEEAKLLEQDTEMLLAARAIDDACDIIVGVENAPKAEFTKLPSGKTRNIEKLREGMRERLNWLEDVARYRIEEPEF